MKEQNDSKIINAGKTTCTCGDGCKCGCGYPSVYHVLRWVLGIFIIFFVFALGIKVGEFLTELRYTAAGANSNYGDHMMMRNSEGFNPGGPMIPAPAPTTTSTTATTPVE